MPRPSVLLITNLSRDGVEERLDDAKAIVSQYATLRATVDAGDLMAPHVRDFDIAVILGGDGTILSEARQLLSLRRPIVGVNFGRLGFLAEFNWDSFREHAQMVFGPNPLIRERMVLEATVRGPDGSILFTSSAINDCVIAAGPPYRMIELRIGTEGLVGGHLGHDGPILTGDGLIVSTPIGSTAYNVSAGGPIVHPDVEGFILTPNAAHSLAFRPIVLPSNVDLSISVLRANEGTSVVVDGQVTHSLGVGDSLHITRNPLRARLVGNPSTSYWQTLLEKMRWAAPPTYRDRGP